MRDTDKTKQQLVAELARLRQRVAEMEASEAERRRTVEALRESEEKYRYLVEQANDGITIIQDTIVQYANPRLLEMWGGTLEEVIGTSFTNFIHPDELLRVVEYYRRRIAGESVVPIYETTLRRKNGERVQAELSAGVITYQGKPADLVIVRDITERKRAEQQVIQAERLATLGRLAAALAHEINNPLQIMQSHLDLLLDFPLAPGEDRQYLDIVRREIKRLSDVARRVLSFAHPRLAPCQPVAVVELVQQVLVLAGKELQRNGIEVTTDWQDVPRVLAEPDQVTQIFLNLVINAVESMPGNGQLHVAVYPEGDQVAISFTNSGSAIPREILPRIFEPFFTTKPGGNGLGLWISHSLVQQHGGSLTVENLENDQGVACIVKLPSALLLDATRENVSPCHRMT
jgi:two-component system sporulation sensor kinase A